MRHLIFTLFLIAEYLAALQAEPFERAEVKKAINIVSLLPEDRQAIPGDVVKGDTALLTGGYSRAELQFKDLTIIRVGSNSLFRFLAGTREATLDGGTILFSSPKGAGGGKVQAGNITAAVTGSDFMISNVRRVKVICLSHKVAVYFTANPRIRAELLPGQMLDIPAGVERKMPPVGTINLGKLLSTSQLNEAGGFGPLPSKLILAQNTKRQAKAFGLAKANLTTESAETVRSTSTANDSPVQSRQTEAVTTAREAATTASAADKHGGGSGENRGKDKNNRDQNKENPGNSGNKENPGNAGIKENPGNGGNKENRGNAGIKENPGNGGKQ
jgi:hypothetical protein